MQAEGHRRALTDGGPGIRGEHRPTSVRGVAGFEDVPDRVEVKNVVVHLADVSGLLVGREERGEYEGRACHHAAQDGRPLDDRRPPRLARLRQPVL